MNYTAEHIDPEKFESALNSKKRYQEELQRSAIEKANAQYEGYCQCLEDVRSMLHCSNYEKTDGLISESIEAGRINAIYAFAKLGGVDCEDIANSNLPFQDEAKTVWDRIWNKMKSKASEVELKNRLHDYTYGINEVLSAIYNEFGIKPNQKVLCSQDGGDPTSYSKLLADKIRDMEKTKETGFPWVSVSERLPGDGTGEKPKIERVIVLAKGEWVEGYFVPSTKNFFTTEGYKSFQIENVTHWAIPELPGEGGET